MRQFDQQPVPGVVTEAVVDDLEAVDVGKEHGHARRPPTKPGQGERQPVEEQGPVRQLGQGVVQGLVGESLLGPLALDHRPELAGHGRDQAQNAAIVGSLGNVEQLEDGNHFSVGQHRHSDTHL